ncbi:MAG: hypothetical protein HY321_17755 [Armatimonadetes bacterium]|nr:hypothetical protein [Armatimonadota bacterium]
MRAWILVALAGGLAAPAAAQFQDLVQETKLHGAAQERPVTLELRRAPAQEAVAKLAEAASVALACAPRLADEKVTLAVSQRPAGEVCEALARLLEARWRKEGKKLVLEPVAALAVLTPPEVAAELRASMVSPGFPGGLGGYAYHRKVLQLFTPRQVELMESEGGLPLARCSRPQQDAVAWVLRNEAAAALQLLQLDASVLQRLEELTVSFENMNGRRWLRVGLPGGGGGRLLSIGEPAR